MCRFGAAQQLICLLASSLRPPELWPRKLEPAQTGPWTLQAQSQMTRSNRSKWKKEKDFFGVRSLFVDPFETFRSRIPRNSDFEIRIAQLKRVLLFASHTRPKAQRLKGWGLSR